MNLKKATVLLDITDIFKVTGLTFFLEKLENTLNIP